ncbi:hypothetical protein T05_2381 [Trichinella murrelli]|uniref:Uncharacterized protein n=1 Tax=Trichinella murrelli TaxID=144512 RepID=A0A0V0SYK7_9BILA|nr:hypothetical protein T05_2381 [Trichinella murrelli]
MEISVLYICLVLKRLYRIAEKFLRKQSVDQHGCEENGMVPLGLNYIRIRAHCSFIGRCLRYFIRP